MFAILTEKKEALKDYRDAAILMPLGYFLKQNPNQKIVHWTDIDFNQIAKGETLYLSEHGANGGMSASWLKSIPLKTGDSDFDAEGISHIIGQALDKAKDPKTGYKCPDEIHLCICSSGLDSEGGNNMQKSAMTKGVYVPRKQTGVSADGGSAEYAGGGLATPSMVRGVSMALAKRGLMKTRVIGYKSPCMISLKDGKMYAAKVAMQDAEHSAFNRKLKEEWEYDRAIEEVLKNNKDIKARALGLFESNAIRGCNQMYIVESLKRKWFYSEKEGTVIETAADAMPYINKDKKK
jgi:hypothetical protein